MITADSSSKRRSIISIIINSIIVLSTSAAIGAYFSVPSGDHGIVGAECFRYFTTDSNVLSAISAAVILYFQIIKIIHPDSEIPQWAAILKFVGTVSVTITLLTVVFFLAPTAAIHGGIRAYFSFFEGSTFVLHFSTPAAAIISTVFFERQPKISRKSSLWGLVPTVLYSVVYLVLVVLIPVWYDWYGFTFGGKIFLAPISMIAMYAVTFIICRILRKLRRD